MKEVESYGQEGVEVVLIGNKVDVKSEEDSVKREAAEVFIHSLEIASINVSLVLCQGQGYAIR